MSENAAADEYTQLREEKGADWRLITQTALATLGTSAAIAVGGLAAHSRILVVAAPLPFYFGVLYLVQSAWLQNRINTFIASRAPEGALNYEKHVLKARRDPNAPQAPRWAISWYWWIGVAATLGVILSGFPFLVRLENLKGFETADPGWITLFGVALLSAFLVVAINFSRKADADRARWETYWTTDGGAPPD